MLTPAFIARLVHPPIPKTRLAKLVGIDEFTLSRYATFLRMVQTRDERIVRLGAALGLEAHEIFGGSSPAEILTEALETR